MTEKKNSAGLTVALMILVTLFSKLLGMVRGILVAGIFADSPAGVAFAAGSQIPLAVFDMLFSAAVLGSFLPIYRGALLTDPARARRFSSSFLGAVTLATAAIAALGVIFAAPILSLSAPGLEAETAALAARLLRLMFPAMIFAGVTYMLTGISQSHERFLLPASVSAISNLFLIGYLLFCGGEPDERTAIGLSIAYLVSWSVQFLTLAIPLGARRLLPLPTVRVSDDLRLALRRSVPVMFGSWLIPAGTLIATFFSSSVADSALAAYTYAFTIDSILAGVLTYGICNYLFPKLSEKAASGETSGFSSALGDGLFASLALVLPVAAAAFFLAKPAVSVLYLRGNFSEDLADLTALALRTLAPAMPAFCVSELLSRAAYANGKVRLPMLAALIGIASDIGFASAFSLAGKLTVAAVAGAFAVGQTAAALTLAVLLRRDFSGAFAGAARKKWLVLLLSTLLSVASMAGISAFLQKNARFSGVSGNFLAIALVFLPSIMVYLLCMILFGALPRPKKKGGDNS